MRDMLRLCAAVLALMKIQLSLHNSADILKVVKKENHSRDSEFLRHTSLFFFFFVKKYTIHEYDKCRHKGEATCLKYVFAMGELQAPL